MTQPSATIAESRSPTWPRSRIFRIENHDEALPIWRDSAGTARILVHVDAHHDMWWAPPGAPITIANFISPALRDGLLREVYWVVPDRSWQTEENRNEILCHLRRIQENLPGRPEFLRIQPNRISTTLLGKPLHVCSIERLPKFQDDVLLDLDVDFLIFPRVTFGEVETHPDVPWIWPNELISRLGEVDVRSDLITIAYSVNGGFTPLRWKYLGDELEARLAGAEPYVLRGMEAMREGAEAAAHGRFNNAEHRFWEASRLLPNLAAPLWHLAHVQLDDGRAHQGQDIYQRALGIDSTYRTPFNSSALSHYWAGRVDAAEYEYRRILALDPDDACAHLGLGWLAMEKSKWREAEPELRKAVELQPDLLDAYRALGRLLRKSGRRREAIAAYEKSLKLALLGHRPLRHIHSVSAELQPWNDIAHFVVYLRLGQLYMAEGNLNRADQYLRMAAAGKQDSAEIRFRLAWIAFRQQKWSVMRAEAGHAIRRAAVSSRRRAKKLMRRVMRPFEREIGSQTRGES